MTDPIISRAKAYSELERGCRLLIASRDTPTADEYGIGQSQQAEANILIRKALADIDGCNAFLSPKN